MTQIVVTLEEGVKAMTEHPQKEDSARMKLFDQLAGSISLKDIDMSDERTKYLLKSDPNALMPNI